MKILIEISQTIRIAPYTMVKPTIGIEFEVPEGTDVKEFYLEKYREVKKIWNLHLYNLLYDTKNREAAENLYKYVQTLVLDQEKFLKLKPKKKKKKGSKND